jgi:hypothetical protein
VGGVDGEAGAGGPLVGAGVGDVLNDGLQRHDVGAGTAKQNQRDLLAESGLPLDGVGGTLRDLLVQTGAQDGVALRRLGVVRLGVGGSEGREGGEDSSGSEAHIDVFDQRMTEVGKLEKQDAR